MERRWTVMLNLPARQSLRLLTLATLGMLSGCAAFHPIKGIPASALPLEYQAESRNHDSTIDLSLLAQTPPRQHHVDGGDVLGIYIEGVLGNAGEAPPISVPSDPEQAPAIGYPITVRDDGTLSLPMIGSIPVRGLTIRQVEEYLRRIYTIDREILQPGQDRIIVSLQRPREVRVLVLRQEAGGPSGTEFAQGLSINLGQSKRGNGQLVRLPAYKNDVLNALAKTGGLPGLDAENTIYIVRRRGDQQPYCDPGMMPHSPVMPHSGPRSQQMLHLQPHFSATNQQNLIQTVSWKQPQTHEVQRVSTQTFKPVDPLAELRVGMHPEQDALSGFGSSPELTLDDEDPLLRHQSTYQWGQSSTTHAPQTETSQQYQTALPPLAAPTHQSFVPQSNPVPNQYAAPQQYPAPQQPMYEQQQPYHGSQNVPPQFAGQQPLPAPYSPAPYGNPSDPTWSEPMSEEYLMDEYGWDSFDPQFAMSGQDPTMNNRQIIKIPVRLKPGEQPNIRTEDILLQDGDIVFIESRETEIFYTAGLLGGGQFTLPRDYDLDVIGAISIAQGASQQQVQRQVGGVAATNGDVTISASNVVILRGTPDGSQITITVDLYKAIKDPHERVIIKPGDIVMLRYKPLEAVGAFIERNLLESALFGLAASQLNQGGN